MHWFTAVSCDTQLFSPIFIIWLQITWVFKVWPQVRNMGIIRRLWKNAECFVLCLQNQDLSLNKRPWRFEHTLKFEKHCCKIPFLNLIRQKPHFFLFELPAIQLWRLNFSFHMFIVHFLALFKNIAHFHPLPVLKLGLFSQMFEYKKYWWV